MNILFIGYWGANEGLSVSTIYPHLHILSKLSEVQKIVYTSIERNGNVKLDISIPKVTHFPLYSGNKLKDKLSDFWKFPYQLAKICQIHQIDVMICRGAPAGSLGYLVQQKNKLPFYVESFEPHAQYMLDSRVWKPYDLRYLLQKYWEKKQKQYAKGLMPVAENYRQQLINEGIKADKIKTVPCAVDLEKFIFSEQARITTRTQLGIPKRAMVGIYVGKYGGLYLDDEAFQLYNAAFKFWPNFYLIILSPGAYHQHIQSQIAQFKLPAKNIFINEVFHDQVPNYLSSSDFAFATYSPGSSKAFLSPIKIGEYWANGLPVLLTDGIGDESEIIKKEGGGTLFCLNDAKKPTKIYHELSSIMNQPSYREGVRKLAIKYRSLTNCEKTYKNILKQHLIDCNYGLHSIHNLRKFTEQKLDLN